MAKHDADPVPVSTRSVYRGRVLDLALDTVRFPTGQTVELEIIRHRGAAAVVPVDADGSVWLVRQYRHATGGYLLEIPAGKLDGGEAPETCAAREIEEEVGRRAGRLEPLGFIWTTPGFTDERIWLYLATGLVESRQALEHDEWLTVERMPLEEAVRLAEEGTIADAKSVCALLRAARRLGVR
jgi:ADP-ribose pyrophosphatase